MLIKFKKAGTWDLPKTINQAKKLELLFRAPIKASDINKLKGLIGDDDLFDLISSEEKVFGKNLDIRGMIARKLEYFLKDSSSWDKESISICKNIVNKFA